VNNSDSENYRVFKLNGSFAMIGAKRKDNIVTTGSISGGHSLVVSAFININRRIKQFQH